MTPLLEDERIREYDVLAIQEPWHNQTNDTTYNPPSSSFHLVHQGGSNVRTCLYVNKKLDPECWSPRHKSNDFCTLEVKIEDDKTKDTLWIHNIYNICPATKQEGDEDNFYILLAQALDQPGEHVVLGDFNLHHPRWNNPGRFDCHPESSRLLALTDACCMELALPQDVSTWSSRGAESAIDLVFLSRGAHAALRTCGPREDLQFGSDHKPLVTELNFKWERAEIRERRAWRKLEDESIRIKVMEKVEVLKSKIGFPALHDSTSIDTYTDNLIQVLQTLAEEAIPVARPLSSPKSFWNRECANAVKAAQRAKKFYRNNRCQQTEDEWKQAERIKIKTLRTTQALHFRRSVHEAAESPKGVWTLCKYGRERSFLPKALPQFPAIWNGETLAEDFDTKVDALRKTFFPPARSANLDDIQDTTYPEPLQTTDALSNAEIRRAISKPKPDKAPGPSGLPNRYLKAIATERGLLDHIRHLFQSCWDVGYHPRRFRLANTIVLKKPNKSDYSQPKAYRPIALLDTFGKALEAVIATRLSECAELNGLLPNEQFGARKGRSVETALEVITESVHTIWNSEKSNVATLLSLDVAGAFDNVSHKRLLHNLRQKGVPQKIVKWVTSFLSDRKTTITLGTRTSKAEEVETGIPQGSPISPMLFLFFNGTLLESCAKLPLPIIAGGFVDDIHLLAFSQTTETNCQILQQAHRTCKKWADMHGASFAPQKYELVHLSRKRKRHNLQAMVSIEEAVINPVSSIRVLGLQIDSKLNWNAHITRVKEKMRIQELGLKMVATSTWGATLKKARVIYSVAVRPAMTFAARIWHQPAGNEKRSEVIARQLTVQQNKCLRVITGAYKSTPVPVLEAESGVPNIRDQLDYLVLSAASKNGPHPATVHACEKIKTQAPSRRRRRQAVDKTPMSKKMDWANSNLPTSDNLSNSHQEPTSKARALTWRDNASRLRWDTYQGTLTSRRSQAQADPWSTNRIKIHEGLQKAESSAVTQIRTGHMGHNAYLCSRRVPGFDRPDCTCGWRTQDAKHLLIFCPELQRDRNEMFRAAGTNDFETMISTPKGIRAAAKWLVRSDCFSQFSLARQQLK